MTRLALNVEIEWLDGFAPVQAEGSVNGYGFWFRARGEHWSFHVYDSYGEIHNTIGRYGVWPDASWMDLDRAETIIVRECHRFVKQNVNGTRV